MDPRFRRPVRCPCSIRLLLHGREFSLYTKASMTIFLVCCLYIAGVHMLYMETCLGDSYELVGKDSAGPSSCAGVQSCVAGWDSIRTFGRTDGMSEGTPSARFPVGQH